MFSIKVINLLVVIKTVIFFKYAIKIYHEVDMLKEHNSSSHQQKIEYMKLFEDGKSKPFLQKEKHRS